MKSHSDRHRTSRNFSRNIQFDLYPRRWQAAEAGGASVSDEPCGSPRSTSAVGKVALLPALKHWLSPAVDGRGRFRSSSPGLITIQTIR